MGTTNLQKELANIIKAREQELVPTGTYPQEQADSSFYNMRPSQTFKNDDIAEAIKNTNFDKGLGPDGFDGHVLLQNADLRGKIAGELINILKDGQLPGYLLEANIVALSKAKGSNQV